MTDLPKGFKVIDTGHGLCLTTDDEKWGYDGPPCLWTMEEAAASAQELVDKMSADTKETLARVKETLACEHDLCTREQGNAAHHQRHADELSNEVLELERYAHVVDQLEEMTGAGLYQIVGHVKHLQKRAGEEAQRWLDNKELVKELDAYINMVLKRPRMHGPTAVAFDCIFREFFLFRGMLTKSVSIRGIESDLHLELYKTRPGAVEAYSRMLDRLGENAFDDHEKFPEYMKFYEEWARRIREQQDA